MAKKVLILVGAPASASLDWTDDDCLLKDFQEPVARFARRRRREKRAQSVPDRPAAWRSMPLRRGHVPTGFSQQQQPAVAIFVTTSTPNTSFGVLDEDQLAEEGGGGGGALLSQFYEHSLAAHDETPSSQLVIPSTSQAEGDTTATTATTTTTSFSSLGASASPAAPLLHPGGDHLSDLDDIPGPVYLVGIAPQTVTVNLVVGILSIATPRTVRTRWGATRSLVEVLVGDETRSGFAVTFWLSSGEGQQQQQQQQQQDSILAGLRPQDVVLVRNVALHVFRTRVYGSSLRRGLTKVHLLYRRRLDATDVGGHYSSADLASAVSGRAVHPQLDKTRRVRDWVLHFVGHRTTRTGEARETAAVGARPWDVPPPDDTQ